MLSTNNFKSTVAVTFNFEFPSAYPEVQPKMHVSMPKGLSETQLETIMDLARAEGESLEGTQMVFSIAQAVQDYLVENNKTAYEEMLERQATKEEEKAGGGAGGEGGAARETANCRGSSSGRSLWERP